MFYDAICNSVYTAMMLINIRLILYKKVFTGRGSVGLQFSKRKVKKVKYPIFCGRKPATDRATGAPDVGYSVYRQGRSEGRKLNAPKPKVLWTCRKANKKAIFEAKGRNASWKHLTSIPWRHLKNFRPSRATGLLCVQWEHGLFMFLEQWRFWKCVCLTPAWQKLKKNWKKLFTLRFYLTCQG